MMCEMIEGIAPGQIEDIGLYLKNLRESMSENTFTAYRTQWQGFMRWCAERGRAPVPASSGTVAEYIDHLRSTGHGFSTVRQAAAAIAREHKSLGLRSPTESEEARVAISAAARALGRASKKKAALTLPLLRDVLNAIPPTGLRNQRDRALLAVGFMGGFRRSELVSLRLGDLERSEDDGGRTIILVRVRRSKTDQESRGMTKALFAGRTVNAVRELGAWTAASGLSGDDWLFPRIRRGDRLCATPLTGQSVALIIKERAADAGLGLDFSGHSLRRGFVTSAIRAGATERSIMNQTGHRGAQTLREYIERRDAAEDNAASLL